MNLRAWRIDLTAVFAAIFLVGGSPINAQAQSCVGTSGPCFQGLGFLAGGVDSYASGVSADGSVVVGSGSSTSYPQQAFRWTAGTISGLGVYGSDVESAASGVSSDGTVVVGQSTGEFVGGINPPGKLPRAVRWVNGTISIVVDAFYMQGPLTYFSQARANGANADGSVVVGWESFTNQSTSSFANQGFVWSNGTTTSLGWLTMCPIEPGGAPCSGSATGVSADGSVVVGWATVTVSASEAFRWVNGTKTGIGFLPGCGSACTSSGSAVTADGSSVFGYSTDSNGRYQAFRWTNGAMTGLGFLSGCSPCDSSVAAVDANGSVVVGSAEDSTGTEVAIRYTPGSGMQSIKALLAAAGISTTGWTLSGAFGISANGGTIVGNGTDPNGKSQGWIARLPVGTVASHDFNGDGKSDIVWQDASGNTAVWLMNGAAVSSTGGLGNVATTWSVVGQRDFDGDGKADLLWRDTSGNTVMWFMDGSQVTSGVAVGNIPTNWSVAGTGDFNGDGFGDILWRDSSGNLALWLMIASAVTSSAGFGNVPLAVSVAGTGDFDGDGKADILWRDTSGNNFIWFMNGTQVASAVIIAGDKGTIPTSWSIVGTGDFDGDGKTDIFWRDNAGNTSNWLMNGATVGSIGVFGIAPSTWSVAQIGDYNGDGKSDLLWRDTSGNTVMWFMNGTSVASTAAVGNIPTNWTVQSVNAE
jgi:probable HAF family extracellular repeat protein